MKISLKWLREYVPVSLSPQDLAHRLTMAGVEVDGITIVGGSWDNVYVGLVTKVEKHPNADRLSLATVELPDESLIVVCGAPNVAQGQRVPFAKVGAQLIDPQNGRLRKLKSVKIRGVDSSGMVCSEREMGISDEHEGIMVLPEDAPIGSPFAEYMGDAILDLQVTPNRPDCLSIMGVAWEVAALTNSKVSWPEVAYEEDGPSVDQLASVEIADPHLCPRYCASVVMGVQVGPSPHWMQRRLISAGMRPINNIVDVTNYVMMEYGQPLHAFDYDKLRDKRIIVRRSQKGEKIITLDGEERTLDGEHLAITDPSGPVALAGVMGGANTEVSEETTSVLLESANFNNVSIRRTSAQLRFKSEASIRFDKGLSPELPLPALKRATQLFAEVAGGKAAKGIIDVYPGKEKQNFIRLTSHRTEQVLGVSVDSTRTRGVLASLGFDCRASDGSALEVAAPYWRTDVSIEDDLVEEVARITGYDQLPTTSLQGQIPSRQPDRYRELNVTVADILASLGMQEVINYSLISRRALERSGVILPASVEPVRVANPMTSEQEYLRSSLRPGLLTNAAQNEKHQEQGLNLFEMGRVYFPRENDLPVEEELLAGIVTREDSVGEEGFLSVKGILETLLERLRVDARFEAGEDPGLYPGRVVHLLVDNDELGVLGEVHPHVAETFDVQASSVYLFEIKMEKLFQHVPEYRRYKPIPRFPGMVRDLALVMDASVQARKVEEIIRSFPLVTSVKLFDIYTGDQVKSGKKSLAYRVLYQSPERTLTEEEVNIVQAQLVQKLDQEVGVALRGSD